jgi:uroporphyrinogen-III synthase
MLVLVTRPAEDQARTAAALAERGHRALAVPVMRVAPIELPPLPGDAAAVVATSAHAFAPVAGGLSAAILALPVFVVGDNTAEAARKAGFADVTSAAGDVSGLIALLAREGPSAGPIVYLAGTPRRDALERASELASRLGVVETYRAEGTPDFPERLAAACGDDWPEAVLHFSANQAAHLAGFLGDARLGPLRAARHLAISAQAGAPLTGLVPWTAARKPTLPGLLDLLD